VKKEKPVVVVDYNNSMGAADSADHTTTTYAAGDTRLGIKSSSDTC